MTDARTPRATFTLPQRAFSRRALLGAAAFGAGAIAFAGPLGRAYAQDATPKAGGVLKLASPPATTIDPLKMNSGGAIAIVQQVAEYLVWTEPDLSLRPMLATAWSTPDDGSTWVFELRRGVKFHDGREMTADDVVASFQRLLDPEQASAAAAQLPFLQKDNVRKVDDYTVEFALDRPIGAFPYYTNVYNAVILPRDYAGDFADKPVGTGPFRLTSYRPQEGATLVRNEDYWDEGQPLLDGVEVALYESAQPQILALQTGDADLMLLSSYLDAAPLRDDPAFDVLAVEGADHRQLAMRTDMKPFDDKRVRQAVALGLNRDAMVAGLLGGLAAIGNDHPIAPAYPENVDLPQRAQDVERAKALLAEAGYPDGFEIDLYTAQFQELPQYAALVREMLAPIGVRVNLKVEPLNVYYDHWTDVSFGLTDWVSRPTPTQILTTAFKSGAEWNAAHWSNEEFDRLVEELDAAVEPERRDALAQRIAAIMHEEVPTVIAYFPYNLRPARAGVQGVDAHISNYLDLRRAWLS